MPQHKFLLIFATTWVSSPVIMVSKQNLIPGKTGSLLLGVKRQNMPRLAKPSLVKSLISTDFAAFDGSILNITSLSAPNLATSIRHRLIGDTLATCLFRRIG